MSRLQAEILALWQNSGLRKIDIARRLQCSEAYVGMVIKNAPESEAPVPKSFQPITTNEVLEAYFTFPDGPAGLAKRLHADPERVQQIFDQRELPYYRRKK